MPAVANVTPTGDVYINGVLSGTKWAVNSLTFSFPTDPTFYGANYGSGEATSGFKAFTAVQQAAVRSIFAEYSSVINFTFTEVTETATTHGALRLAESNVPPTAWTYMPTTSEIGGDMWFNNPTHWYDSPVIGNYGYYAMIHEIGHSLGLKHPQSAVGAFGTMPLDHDALEYTVMSYRSYIGAGTAGLSNEAWGYPQTLMMYDVAALQTMYGANYTTNAGDTVYKWNPLTGQEFINGIGQAMPGANRIFMNIWDGGGHDTYDFSNYTTNLKVNLNPGAWTTVSTAQLAYLGGGHYADGNISNSLLYQGNTASLIEDAIGGSGNDTIVGNAADNHLTGGGGNDYLDGGAGNDTAVYSGARVNYQLVHNTDGSWTVTDLRAGSPDGTDTLVNIENVQFTDGVIALNTIQTQPNLQVPAISSFTNDSGIVGDNITNDNTLTFNGTATAGSTVKVFDGTILVGTAAVTTTGIWTLTTAALADGNHNFTTQATDASGNSSATSAALTITIDTVAPNAPVISGFSPDSNISGDGITNASTLTLQGTAEAGSTVQIYDGTTLLGSTTASTSGAWSFTTYNPTAGAPALIDPDEEPAADIGTEAAPIGGVTTVLADGQHAFIVKAVDAAGNISAPSATLNVTVDTAAPAAPVISTFSGDSGVAGDGITNDNTLLIGGTAEAGSTVRLYDGATLIGVTTAGVNGAWTVATATLADGVHQFTAKATNLAGNTGVASAAFAVTVDTIAPTAPTVSGFSPDTGTIGDGLTSANQITLTGLAEANSTVQIFDGASFLGTAIANASGSWSFPTTTALVDGSHAFLAKAVDAAGNVSAGSTILNVIVNTSAPSVPVITSFATDSGVVGDGLTNVNILTINGTAAAGSTVQIYDGANPIGSTVVNASGVWHLNTSTLADGTHQFTAKASDSAGNISATSAAFVVTVDTIAPTTPTVTGLTSDTRVVGNELVNVNHVTVTGTAEANSSVQVFDGNALVGTVTADTNGAWSIAATALTDGTHQFTAKATDAAGNTSAASTGYSITVDTTAPTAPVVAGFSPDTGTIGDGITKADHITVSGTAEANSIVRVYDGSVLAGTIAADANGNWSLPTAALKDGVHAFAATATDAAGNTSVSAAALNVTIDTLAPGAPAVSGFSAVSPTGVVSPVSGGSFANTDHLKLTGTADSGATVQIFDNAMLIGTACATSSGTWTFNTATLAQGAHSFTAKATDAAGNTGLASSAFSVQVDTIAPNAPSIVSFSPDTGTIGDGMTKANVLAVAGTAEALSTISIYDGNALLGSAQANAAGSWTFTTTTLANGVHNFTANATDAANNTSIVSNTLSVTVDPNAPNPINHAPTVSATDITPARGQALAASTLFTASDSDGDAIAKYQFLDITPAANSGSFVINGNVQAPNTLITVSASDLSQTSFVAGAAADTIMVRAFDGSAWSGWTTFHVAPPDRTAVVAAANVTAARGQSYAMSSVVSATDADGDAITSYQFMDANSAANSGGFVVNGVAQSANSLFTVSADQLSQASFTAGAAADTIYVRAFDGITWGAWTTFRIASPDQTAVVSAADVTAVRGQSYAIPSIISATDADGDAITSYQFMDITASALSGHIEVNGVGQAANSIVTVSADQLSQASFVAGSAADTVMVRAFDGVAWGAWTTFHVTAPNHTAVVTAADVTAVRGQSYAIPSIISATDADGDAITSYQFMDISASALSGHLEVNGVWQTPNTLVTVSANQLSQASFTAGAAADTIYVRAFDGVAWGAWTTFHVTAPDHTAIVTAPDVAAVRGQSYAVSSLISATDADHDAISSYQFMDVSPSAISGHLEVNGVGQAANTLVTVSADQLSQTSFIAGAAADTILVRAFDGVAWGAWTTFHIAAPNQAPVIAASNVSVAANQTIGVGSLFSTTDGDGDLISSYQIWEAGTNGGHLNVNGVAQAAGAITTVSADQLSQVDLAAGTGNDTISVRAFDGITWGAWTPIKVGVTPVPQGASAPAIVGTANNDVLVSSSASENLTGGSGSDTFVFAQNFGKDTITDFQATGPNHDVIQFSQNVFGDFAAVLAHAAQIGTDVVITADSANSVTLKNTVLASLQSNDFHIV